MELKGFQRFYKETSKKIGRVTKWVLRTPERKIKGKNKGEKILNQRGF